MTLRAADSREMLIEMTRGNDRRAARHHTLHVADSKFGNRRIFAPAMPIA